ncbi:uncharacterized protein LOC113868016, partial [Abrus precatorius]|uniref:Uncharacterized protein LOC113868016 n=1 Tax=Abrus precatorius TaxID=3816 RepID=A0A8B8LUC6_ABRPR
MQKEKEEAESVDSFLCPSFSAYSSNKLNDVADQVTRHHQNDHRFDANDDAENDFEFVAFRKVADGVFFDASPAFPIFNRDLKTTTEEDRSAAAEDDAAAIQITLGKLMMDDSPSSSSSEVEDELEAIPAGTYCVWTPKPVESSPNRCKKSKSTGSSSSKRWKLLNLLRRSNSEGKESFVFLTPSSSSVSGFNRGKKRGENSKDESGGAVAEKKIPASSGSEKRIPAVSAHEALYVRNREMRRVDKRKSYLPYRQDLVGFCVSLNAMGKGFPLHF